MCMLGGKESVHNGYIDRNNWSPFLYMWFFHYGFISLLRENKSPFTYPASLSVAPSLLSLILPLDFINMKEMF